MRSCLRAARRRTSTEPASEPAASSSPVTTLRGGIVGLLLRGSAATGLRWSVLDRTQAALQIVENKPYGRLGSGRRCDHPLAVADDEDAAGEGRRLELRHPRPQCLGRFDEARGAV